MKGLIRSFIAWIPLAIAIVGISILVYGAVQQDYRQSLNDPQIQMAEDGAAALKAGAVPASLVTRAVVLIDIATSLAPWIAVYDQQGTLLESSAVLNGGPPAVPVGIIAAVQSPHAQKGGGPVGEDRVTWQPSEGVRQAIVAVSAGNGYVVVSGRNMREVESRESNLASIVGFALIVLLAATFAGKVSY